MKKHFYIILLAALLLLCACQPTPDEPVVLQKDQELMIQQGTAILEPEEPYTPPEVPNRYRFDYQDGALTIHADAKIVEPSVPMPIVNVRAQGFPQEMMYRLYRMLSNGEELLLQRRMTKAELAELIRQWNEQMDAGPEAWDDMTQEQYQEGLRRKIARAEEDYKTAPETDERQVADGTYRTIYVEWTKADCQTVVADNQNRTFVAYSYENGQGDSYLNSFRTDHFTLMNAVPLEESTPLPEGLNAANARTYVQELLDAIGEPFEIAEVYRVGSEQDDSGDPSLKAGARYALRFDCRRIVNGAPLSLYSADAGYADERSYAIPWAQEKLQVIVDGKGIVSVDWIGPLTFGDSVAEATTLLPFDKIDGIAKKMIPIVYNPSGWSEETKAVDIQVRSVRLELMRVREENNVQELKGLLVPVWMFYGTIAETVTYDTATHYAEYCLGGGPPFYTGDTMILCINAIDGTIIDPLLGY